MRSRSHHQVETVTAVRYDADDEPLPIDAERERELRRVASGAVTRRAQSNNVGSVRRKLKASAALHIEHAASIVGGRPDKHLAASEYDQFQRSVNSAVRCLEQSEQLGTLEHHAVSVQEPSPYFKGSPHSFYADLCASVNPQMPDLLASRTGDDMRREAVDQRLRRHAVDMRSALRKGTPWGQQIKAAIHESCREEDEHQHRKRAERELRVLQTGGGITASAGTSAGAFVSPAFLLSAWAPFRGIERTFADQCRSVAMPPYGMQLLVPYFSSTDKVAKQTEGSPNVTETLPSTELEGAAVQTLTGQIVITQQILDRALLGSDFDELVFTELRQRLDQETDFYVLNQAITNGEAVTGETTYSTKGLYKDVALAREKLQDTAGTRLRPISLFSTSDLFNYATRQVDTNERPLMQPWFSPPQPNIAGGLPSAEGADSFDGQDRPPWSRFASTVMPGGLLWYTDDNIPRVGTSERTQILVSAPSVAIVLAESEPILTVFRESIANQLECIVNLRAYVCAVTRHKAGTAVVSSSAYTVNQV
jgi:hypothetical protein